MKTLSRAAASLRSLGRGFGVMSAGRKPSFLTLIENAPAAYVAEKAAEGRAKVTIEPPARVAARPLALEYWHALTGWCAVAGLLQDVDAIQLAELAELCADREDLRKKIGADWSYKTVGRSGIQWKTRPEVAQLNLVNRMISSIAADYGATPVARLRLSGGLQGDLFGDDGDGWGLGPSNDQA